MIQEDRLTKILALIESKQSISVTELQETLYVSAATVRRDLAELSRRGLIVRSFGGAVSLTGAGRSVPKTEGSLTRLTTPVAHAAAELIREHSTIFLDGSSAVQSMLPELNGKNGLTVVTDSMSVAERLSGSVERLYLTGGIYNSSLNIFTGRLAQETAAHYRYDFAFISCDGVTNDGMISDYCIDKLPIIKTVLKRTANNVLLCPAAIIGKEASNELMPLSVMDTVISDEPEFFRKSFKGHIIAVRKDG